MNYLILLTILGWGISPIFTKTALNTLHPVLQSAISTSVYAIFLPAWFYFFKPEIKYNLNAIVNGYIAAILTTLGSIAYLFAMQRGASNQVVALGATYPVITALASLLILGEQLSFIKMLGIGMTSIGAYLIVLKL